LIWASGGLGQPGAHFLAQGGILKTILFTYQSRLGTFWIRPEPAGRVRLGIDRELLKSYASATAAARAVAERQTGWAAWDMDTLEIAPPTLRRWKRGAPGGRPRTNFSMVWDSVTDDSPSEVGRNE